MTGREIMRTIGDYANSAVRAREAGYDGVEIMGSEGYLINQFLAERTNKRTDEWGGTPEKRRRFAVEVVKAAPGRRSAPTSSSSTGCRCSIWSRAARAGTTSSRWPSRSRRPAPR